ncbi:HAMP domain-containing histidine kinase [Halobacillus litoralis]|uniref:sensor histidine kinase n=1 Tax=Halobacillus litoralis TaxID=45668 RepID=UPI001CD59F9E|nr:HAMP domain-containing sensor histidine kinase [Halobacillus litoralis]MCA0970531.1 HAMP domain-containing histidine kinase [Halobacillus litoralis]
MKVRTWLVITYLIVMLLPLAAAYGFFVLIQEWDQSKRISDTFELTQQIQSLENELQHPDLYEMQPLEALELKLPDRVIEGDAELQLYRADAVRIYSSEASQQSIQQIDRSRLMENLYQYDLSYHALTVKKPVFEDEQIVGVYELSIDRSEWVTGVENRRTWVVTGFILFFIFVYATMIWLLQRKLNRPLKELMQGMSTFASKQRAVSFQYKRKDEIGQLMHHFEKMQEQIESAQAETKREQEEKQLMMASFSHDIKTPLTSLHAYAEALENEQSLSDSERRDYMQIIKRKSIHLKGMIEDLTTYAKLQSNQYEMPLTKVDAEEFFEMVFEGYDELARQQHIRLRKEITIDGSCKMNDQHMVRYLDNLMSNALRYTPADGTIGLGVIGCHAPLPEWIFEEAHAGLEDFRSQNALLIVQNDGPPISQEHIDSVLTPFYQGEQARTSHEAKHSGLGLSIAKQIAEKHNGEMKLWSFEQQGTVIAMRFPQ